MNMLATLLLALVPQQRLVVTHDGNYHDKDDIGAVAMVEALVWQANAQATLVHLDHSNHVGATDASQHADMVASATAGLDLFAISSHVVKDDVMQTRASLRDLVTHINASSPKHPLTIIQAGPWEFVSLAFDRTNPFKHQYVHIISHSTWNDDHQHLPSHRNKDTFFDQYEQDGKFDGFKPPTYQKINDQNGYAFNSSLSEWEWLVGSPQTAFVLERTIASDYAAGDMSDAGMVWYYLTGDQTPSMEEVREFFKL